MSAPASEDLRELERLLANASDSGETVSLNAMREEFPDWPRDGLLGALGTLREHGKAVEDAPGEWRGPSSEDASEAPRVAVSVSDEPEEEDARPPARAVMGVTGERVAMVSGEPTVRLTRSIAEALDSDALGKVVQAALNGLEDGEVFVLEVTP